MRRTGVWFVLVMLAAIVVGPPDTSLAQSSTQPDESSYAAGLTLSPPPAWTASSKELIDAKARPAGILPYGPVSFLDAGADRLNSSLDSLGLQIGFSYTAAFTRAATEPGPTSAMLPVRMSTSSAIGDCSALKAARTTAISTSPPSGAATWARTSPPPRSAGKSDRSGARPTASASNRSR